MAYTLFHNPWKDLPDTTTPITAASLDHIETGIQTAAGIADGAVVTFNVKTYGAVGKAQSVADGAMTSGSAVLTSASGKFAAADVGKKVAVQGAAGGVTLVSTIASFQSSSQVTLADAASTTVTSKIADWGTDDSAAIQSAITACVAAGGGIVYMPAGAYLIASTLDFSGLDGTLKQLTFLGAGSGTAVPSAFAYGATKIVNLSSGTALKAQGSGTAAGIFGLRFERFSVQNVQALGTNWTILWDGVASMGGMRDVVVQGLGAGANDGYGIKVSNFQQGQLHFENVEVARFKDGVSEGIRFSTEVTAAYPTGVNSGNITGTNLITNECSTGIRLYGGANLLDGVTLNSPKAYGHTVTGILIGGTCTSCTINAPHSEGSGTGYYLDAAVQGVTINSPLHTGGTNADGKECIVLTGAGCHGNTIVGGIMQNHQYGCTFSTGCSGNRVEILSTDAFSAPAVATLFRNVSAPLNNRQVNLGSFYPGQEIEQVTHTNQSTTATTEATATAIVTGAAHTYDGLTKIRVEYVCGAIQNSGAGNSNSIALYDGASSVGIMGTIYNAGAGTADAKTFVYEFPPTAGSHTYSIRAYVTAGTGTFAGGAGGSGARTPGQMTITVVPQ